VQKESRLERRLRRGIEGLRLWLWRRISAHLRVHVGCAGNCEFVLAPWDIQGEKGGDAVVYGRGGLIQWTVFVSSASSKHRSLCSIRMGLLWL
jgi:hypothetical protein